MERKSKTTSLVGDIDLTIPVNTKEIMAKVDSSDCFGKVWDLRTSECSKCADRDICGIVFNDTVVKSKVKQVQDEQGAIFLDLTDFENITAEDINDFVVSGETTTKELIAFVMAKAQTSDRKAAVQYLKRFITSTPSFSTKKGIVWVE